MVSQFCKNKGLNIHQFLRPCVPPFVAKELSSTNLLSSDSPISLFNKLLSPFVLPQLTLDHPSGLNSNVVFRHKPPLLR